MHVSLTEALDAYVRERVESGLYNNASEVVREALRLKMQQDQADKAKLDALRRDIDVGWKQAEAGQFVELDFDELNRELDETVPSALHEDQKPVG